jgi:DNA end-binding protein Ku
MEVLRYADEVQKAQGYFREIDDAKPDKELLELATTLIDKKTAPFEPEQFHDRYVDALHVLIEKKRKAKGKQILEDVSEPVTSSKGNVIDLMAALKKSLDSGDKAAPAKKAAAKKAPARKRA